jgi:hypothetical protein
VIFVLIYIAHTTYTSYASLVTENIKMNAATAQTVLVVFLSTALLIFLVLGIIATTLAIQILRDIKQISRRAEETTQNLADISKMIGDKVAPVALSAAIAAALRRLTNSENNSKKGDE